MLPPLYNPPVSQKDFKAAQEGWVLAVTAPFGAGAESFLEALESPSTPPPALIAFVDAGAAWWSPESFHWRERLMAWHRLHPCPLWSCRRAMESWKGELPSGGPELQLKGLFEILLHLQSHPTPWVV